jgi:hypothetical protein
VHRSSQSSAHRFFHRLSQSSAESSRQSSSGSFESWLISYPGGTGGYFEWTGVRVLELRELARFPEGDGICTILHIETRARAAILTAAPASIRRHLSSCSHHCPAITCPRGGPHVSALSPGILVAVALQDATSFTGIREPTTPKRNMARFFVYRVFVHRTSFFVGSKSFPYRRFRHFAL